MALDADLDAAISNIWGSDFVQKNPSKSYKVQYANEYNKVAAYLNGGAEPDFSTFSKIGKGLCQAEKVQRALTPVPPPSGPPVITSSINEGDIVDSGVTWSVTTDPNVESVELWADGSKLATDTSEPYTTVLNLADGRHQLGIAYTHQGQRVLYPLSGLFANITVGTGVPPPPPPPPDPPSGAVWSCDYEDAWPGRAEVALDSWAPGGGSTIDMDMSNANFNFHIVSSGVVLPQWGRSGEFKLRQSDQLADGRYAVLLQAKGVNPGNPEPPYLWIRVPEDLYIATWFYKPSDSVGNLAPLLWEFHQRGELDWLLLPDGVAPHAMVFREGQYGGWYPRPGDGFKPTSGPYLAYRATFGDGSPSSNPNLGWVAKTWAICPAPVNTFLKVIVRIKMANDSSGKLQVWVDTASGTNPGSFGAPVIDYSGPTEMFATAKGFPAGLGLYGCHGLYTGRTPPTGLVHVYNGGMGRAHSTFAAAAAEFS